MSQVPLFPRTLLFRCETAPLDGGETPVLRSDELYTRVQSALPDFCDKLERLGVIYTRTIRTAPRKH